MMRNFKCQYKFSLGGMLISRKQKIIILICLPAALFALLYAGGFVSQFFCNYKVWQEAGGEFGTAPEFPDPGFFV